MKIFRIIGREGRITIPWAIRQKVGFRPDDVVSFQLMEDDSVLVRRESTCGKEKNPGAGRDASITAFLDSLDEKQRYSALVHLSVLWAQSHMVFHGQIHRFSERRKGRGLFRRSEFYAWLFLLWRSIHPQGWSDGFRLI